VLVIRTDRALENPAAMTVRRKPNGAYSRSAVVSSTVVEAAEDPEGVARRKLYS